MLDNIGERISLLRTHLNYSQEEFGEKISVSRFAISNYEAGKRNVTERSIRDICREFHVSYIWLTEGIGKMFDDTDNDLMTLIDNLMMGENETAKAIFRAFAKLDDSDWMVIQKLIDEIKK